MKKCLALVVILVLGLAAQVRAENFNCNDPQFGRRLADIDPKGEFVKFMEKDGVAYYNWTGACRMPAHERIAPLVVYAAVKDKLYARIMRTFNDDLEIIKAVANRYAGDPKQSQDGPWEVLAWDLPEKSLKLKVKFNNRTKESKSAYYFEPLRQELEAAAKAKAPEDSLD